MLLFVALCVWSDLGKLRLQAMAGRRVFCWQTLLMKVRCRLGFSYRFIDLDPVLKVYVYIPASTSSCYFLGNDWKPGFPSQSPVLPISWYQPWPPRPFCSPLRRRSGLHQAARAPKTVDQVFFFWTWYIMIWQWPNMIDKRLGSQSKAWWEFQSDFSECPEREGGRELIAGWNQSDCRHSWQEKEHSFSLSVSPVRLVSAGASGFSSALDAGAFSPACCFSLPAVSTVWLVSAGASDLVSAGDAAASAVASSFSLPAMSTVRLVSAGASCFASAVDAGGLSKPENLDWSTLVPWHLPEKNR